jgi:hypothetical protein
LRQRGGESGGSRAPETIPYFTRALRTEPVACQGKLLARDILTS